jgi:enoyl-CoA hydratase/carnithine racemase
MTQDAGVATITIQFGTENDWNAERLESFNSLLLKLTHDPNIRALVLTGSGETGFCQGVDLGSPPDGIKMRTATLSRLCQQTFGSLRRFPGLTVAAISGDASDVGLESTLSCDLRIATATSTFTLAPGRRGRLPVAGATQMLPRLVGETWAKRMMLCGHTVNGEKAFEIGLVDALEADSSVLERASEWAHDSLWHSPGSVSATKKLIEHARMRPLETGFAAERDWLGDLLGTPDEAEGRAAPLANRDPHWQGDS